MASSENSYKKKCPLKRSRDRMESGSGRDEENEEINSFKKPCSQGSSTHSQKLTAISISHLPSPMTSQEASLSCDILQDDVQNCKLNIEDKAKTKENYYSSPPEEDTQAFSQLDEFDSCEKDAEENTWGSLIPIDGTCSDTLILHKRHISRNSPSKLNSSNKDKNYMSTGGYLIGRHPECDLVIADPLISNRHAIIFIENKEGYIVAVLEDLSSNGTFVNEGIIGRNKRRELQDFDEVSILDRARFIFRYSNQRLIGCFGQNYELLEKLGKGHFAEVFSCVEKLTGHQYAVKVFNVQHNESDINGLKQEIGVLMSVSHQNILCIKGAYEEHNNIYLLLELATEGELFKWIVKKEKLTEKETRHIFIQLFQGVKYLHDRGIAHRDIKPENVLLVDKVPNIKLADFGLAKIIGEESFTTSLCGTPSYVAPEILEESDTRRYNCAVDIWALGVVLYICLCGFPPFSDELTSDKYPYTLTQQIKKGDFDYPSPYWDTIGDPALDLIDKMLTVDVRNRISIDECLEHPWLTQRSLPVTNDHTETLIGDLAQLDFSKRRVLRERTLLTSINSTKSTGFSSSEVNESSVEE
ncbi:putative serine/threonine-protein kinase fhkC [Erysiphe neolycopersici]|uniref:Putative serine/threonine-protein kinase fhkC n=1 Tax=Erysiphe neolycopersici TaxID=212602 RepID=A0A420HYN2_9PEZI|nr:putative serine/threonine-protein kinase fhkC [Erysiphe neolycopersici]